MYFYEFIAVCSVDVVEQFVLRLFRYYVIAHPCSRHATLCRFLLFLSILMLTTYWFFEALILDGLVLFTCVVFSRFYHFHVVFLLYHAFSCRCPFQCACRFYP